ncbi:MPPE1-like protein [Mya arenaria]|uniref:MPPE1-like protein n=1 Tax=Mya arenaria TaxID=6604 RepID=A0ABY7ET26_MYAAR|nr:MPPE1-like protein [Mya arenaria]
MVKKNVKVSVRMMWFCQLPSRFCFYIRTKRLVRVVVLLLLVLFYCEFLHYYIVLLWCTWPHLASPAHQPLRVMIIGDTHILGSNAHWFDKLRREWQMVRSFQASMLIHRPDVVFVLGDLMDYGTESSTQEFHHHVTRFKEMFDTPAHTHMEVIVGNHDIGFHNMMTPKRHDRFKEAFDTPSIRLVTIRDVNFVLVNSMALEGDGCSICSEAESKLRDIKWQLKCSKGKETGKFVADVCEKIETLKYSNPILLQHFPMYRTSDINCSTPDAAPKDERDIPFRNKIDCISKESTDMRFVLKNGPNPSESMYETLDLLIENFSLFAPGKIAANNSGGSLPASDSKPKSQANVAWLRSCWSFLLLSGTGLLLSGALSFGNTYRFELLSEPQWCSPVYKAYVRSTLYNSSGMWMEATNTADVLWWSTVTVRYLLSANDTAFSMCEYLEYNKTKVLDKELVKYFHVPLPREDFLVPAVKPAQGQTPRGVHHGLAGRIGVLHATRSGLQECTPQVDITN